MLQGKRPFMIFMQWFFNRMFFISPNVALDNVYFIKTYKEESQMFA